MINARERLMDKKKPNFIQDYEYRLAAWFREHLVQVKPIVKDKKKNSCHKK
jgi:hypothetical protein